MSKHSKESKISSKLKHGAQKPILRNVLKRRSILAEKIRTSRNRIQALVKSSGKERVFRSNCSATNTITKSDSWSFASQKYRKYSLPQVAVQIQSWAQTHFQPQILSVSFSSELIS